MFDALGFAHMRFPASANGAPQAPHLCFEAFSPTYADPSENLVYSDHSSGLHSPTGTDAPCTPASFAGYGACASPHGSPWPCSSGTTPSDGILTGHFAPSTGSCFIAGSMSQVAAEGTLWDPFAHLEVGRPEGGSTVFENSVRMFPTPLVDGCDGSAGGAFAPEIGGSSVHGNWEEIRSEAICAEPRVDNGGPSRGRKARSRRSSGRKVSPEEEATVTGPALRTAARKQRWAKPVSKPGESTQAHRARASHNQVEKEYRNRLHGYFERLLQVLPDEVGQVEQVEEASWGPSPSGSTSSGSAQGQNKRLSKAEVLQKARLHIAALEAEAETRRREIARLRRTMEQAVGGQ